MDFTVKSLPDSGVIKTECLVIPVSGNNRLSRHVSQINKACGGQLQRALKRGDIGSDIGDTLLLSDTGLPGTERILLVAAGDNGKLNEKQLRTLVGKVAQQLQKLPIKQAALLVTELKLDGRDEEWLLEHISTQLVVSSYRYQTTLSKPAKPSNLKKIALLGSRVSRSQTAAAQRGKAIGTGMNLTRELGNLPGNICTPAYLASQARSLARKSPKLRVSVIEEKKMRELGMGALLSVTAGTDQPAKLIVMQYQGASKTRAPHVLVGKGITFDSGGISLKPGAKMDEMKYDMCGAASVLGTMAAVIELGLPINLVGVIAAAENLPSGRATKPGDVVTSMSGKTIEILNTDAEGRLVLCDALTYVARFKPASVIDIATLTGACVVALGSHASGLYSNQQSLADELLAAGQQSWDRAWQMPLWDDYQEQLKSNFADMANIGGPEAGSVTAACFLARFAEDYRWAHLDIAGTAWLSGASKGGTGRPVGMLTRYLINQSGA